MGFEWLDRGAIPVHPMKKPLSGQTRIACVGDSITYGYGVKGWRKNNYPAVLAAQLGDAFCVNNYGVSGSTASKDGDQPYSGERMFAQSLLFLPDLVILMLGTNDTKTQNWKGQAHYSEAMRRLIRAYRSQPNTPQILLLSPPPAWGTPVAFDISAEILQNEIRPATQRLAEEEDIFFADLFAVFSDHPELFWDGVHPNAAGARKLSETVYQCIVTKGLIHHD